jgi:hypothetical protein
MRRPAFPKNSSSIILASTILNEEYALAPRMQEKNANIAQLAPGQQVKAPGLQALQKLLTHGSAQMTQRYAHLADEAPRRAAAVAGDVFQGATGEKAAVIPFAKDKQA